MEHQPGRPRWSCALLQPCQAASLCRQAFIVWPVIWDTEQRAQHSEVMRWFSAYIRERWFTASHAKECGLNPLQQIWSESLSCYVFISFVAILLSKNWITTVCGRYIAFWSDSWDVSAASYCFVPAYFLFIFLFLHSVPLFCFVKESFFLTLHIVINGWSLHSVAKVHTAWTSIIQN